MNIYKNIYDSFHYWHQPLPHKNDTTPLTSQQNKSKDSYITKPSRPHSLPSSTFPLEENVFILYIQGLSVPKPIC